MKSTLFKSMGIGIVLSNKDLRSKEIEVFLPSLSNMRDGEIIPATSELKFDVKDLNQMQTNGTITLSSTTTATWLSFNSNMLEAPSVRRGERVEIFHIEGEGEVFYWRELGLDGHLRRRDTIIFALSNTIDESVTELTPENTYWIEFSTHTKQFRLVTTKSDEEPYAFDIKLDTKTGTLTVGDDIGNGIGLVSKENLIQFANAQGTYVKLEKNLIELETDEGAHVLMQGPDVLMNNSDGSTYELIGPDIKLTSSGGGSLVINDKVTITSAGGAEVSLTDGVSVSGATVNLDGGGSTTSLAAGSVELSDGAGTLAITGGMIQEN